MELEVVVLADRLDLMDALWKMEDSWPEFMVHDPIGNLYYGHLEEFADTTLLLLDEAGEIAAKAHSVPFRRTEEELERDELPVDGWDGVIRRALSTRLRGQQPNAISALEIALVPSLLGTGLSGTVVAALRDNAARLGFDELVAPVRPNGVTDPHEPMSSYAFRTREDGLPVDPWLRVHVRAGGRIDTVAPRSMVIPGTLEEWRRWTGLPFDRSGPVEVPQALTPVHCDLEHGTAVYTEPNVWVRHPTGA